MKIKIVAYCRVSSIKQKNEATIEQQEYEINQFLINNSKFDLVDWFKDDGESGFNRERESYVKMLELLENNNEIAGVIVRDLSRLGRDSFELLRFHNEVIEKLDKRLIMTNLNIDTGTKEGKFIYTNMASMIEYQARDSVERMIRSKEIKRMTDPNFREGRKPIEIPDYIKKKMIKWYEENGLGFTAISKLLQTEKAIIELKEEHIKKQKEAIKKKKIKGSELKFSRGWVRLRLREWGVEFRNIYEKSA